MDQIVQRQDGTFLVDSGKYHVVPRSVDPFNKYDYEEIQAYAQAHPEEVVTEEVFFAKDRLLAEERSIQAQLRGIDEAAVRPLRAVTLGVATQFDTDKLASLESQAATLRARLAEIRSALAG